MAWPRKSLIITCSISDPVERCRYDMQVTCKAGLIPRSPFLRGTICAPGGRTLGISGWGCAAGTLEPLIYTRASSAEFCYPILE